MADLLAVMLQTRQITPKEAVAVRNLCKKLDESPIKIMRSLNIASPEKVQDTLHRYFGFAKLTEVDLINLTPSHKQYLPKELALNYSCFCIKEEHNALYIATEDPLQLGDFSQLKFFLGKRVIPVCGTVYQIAVGLQKIYDVTLRELNLTTEIEKSRGVLGGMQYGEPPITVVPTQPPPEEAQPQVLTENDLEDLKDDSAETIEFSSSDQKPKEEKVAPPPKEEAKEPAEEKTEAPKNEPPKEIVFLDGSSGSIDPELLKLDDEEEGEKENADTTMEAAAEPPAEAPPEEPQGDAPKENAETTMEAAAEPPADATPEEPQDDTPKENEDAVMEASAEPPADEPPEETKDDTLETKDDALETNEDAALEMPPKESAENTEKKEELLMQETATPEEQTDHQTLEKLPVQENAENKTPPAPLTPQLRSRIVASSNRALLKIHGAATQEQAMEVFNECFTATGLKLSRSEDEKMSLKSEDVEISGDFTDPSFTPPGESAQIYNMVRPLLKKIGLTDQK